MTTRFSGVIPPLVTPFAADGSIDFADLTRLVEHLIAEGMDGLFVLGSTGEVAYLTDEQRAEVIRCVVEAAAGRVPVVAGAMDLTGARVAQQAARAQELGADAVVATAPFYALNDMNEIADHFRRIAAAVSIPLFAYDVPVRIGGTRLNPAMLVELAREGVVAGVKDSSGDDVNFRRLVAMNRAAGSPLTLLTGHECMVDGMLLLGADGCVPGYGNVDPARYAALWRAAQDGDWEEARRVQDEICAGFEIVFQPTGRSLDAAGVGAFKTAMQELGVISTNRMADPVQPVEGEAREAIAAIVRESVRERVA